jgi:hypothetical protein
LRVYPETNEVYRKTIKGILSKLEAIHREEDSLTLLITHQEIFFDEEKVYKEDNTEGSLSDILFRDGIKSLTFLAGIPASELEEFLKTVAMATEVEDEDKDVVSLIWERDLHYITYELYDIGFEDEDYETEAIEQVQRVSVERKDLRDAYEDALDESETMANQPIVEVSEEDREFVRKSLETDVNKTAEDLTWVLFEVLPHVTSTEHCARFAEIIQTTLLYLVDQGVIGKVVDVIVNLRAFQTEDGYCEELKKALRKVDFFVDSSEFIFPLLKGLDTHRGVEQDTKQKAIRLLSPVSSSQLLEALQEISDPLFRETVMRRLGEFGELDVRWLEEKMNDWRWLVVRDVIEILRAVGNDSAVDCLGIAVRKENPEVRKKAILTIGEIGSEKGLNLIEDCLDDPSEPIRFATMEAMGRIGTSRARDVLVDVVRNKEFETKSFEEKKAMLGVLSKWKDPEVNELLLKLLRQRSLFKRKQKDETRAAAAYGVGKVGASAAKKHLLRLVRSRNPLLREHAVTAMAQLNRQGEDTQHERAA